MDNNYGGLGAGQAATLALLADTARAGRGYYGGEGGYGGPYATPSSIQHSVNANRQSTEDQADCTRTVIGMGVDRIANAFETSDRDRQFNDIRNGQFQGELRLADRVAAIQAEINANARSTSDKFAAVELNQCKDTASILAKVESLSKEGIARDLDRAERELTALRTQVACGCTTGCSKPCNGN